MKLIVSAADFAMTEGITDGCLRAIRDGILTDVGLMTNQLHSARRAVEELKKYPHVSMGIDFNLVSGKPASDPAAIPSLVGADGRFISSRIRRAQGLNEINQKEAELEFDQQMRNFIQLTGQLPVYIMGHSWSSPNLVQAGKLIAERYGVPAQLDPSGFEAQFNLKRPRASWYTFARENLQVFSEDPDRLRPQLDANLIRFLIEDQAALLDEDLVLLRTHCGYCDSELFTLSTFNLVRIRDLEALCSPQVRQWIADHQIELISMKQFFDLKLRQLL